MATMPSLFNAARSAGTRAHALLCLLIVLTFLRAFIPAGFMPDPTALAQGRFALMPCPAAGGTPLQASLAAADSAASHARHIEPPAAGHAGHVQHVASSISNDHAHEKPAAADRASAGHAMHVASADGAINAPTEHSGHADTSAQMDCPFSLLAHVSFDVPPPVAVALLTARPDAGTPVPAHQSRPPFPAAGPPLGSRAPPLQA